MMRTCRSILWGLWCVLAACGGARCDGSKGDPPASSAQIATPRPDLRVVVVTDPRGYLEPCGCQQRPLGGLDKAASVIAKARADGVPLLIVSAGELAFGTELHPGDAERARQQERWRAEAFMDAWKQLGMTAAAPGTLDLGQDRAHIVDLAARGGFPWLVDNGSVRAGAPSPLQKARVVDVGGVKVGLLGLIAPDARHPLPDDLTLDPDLPAIAGRTIEALRGQGAQLVVALVSADRRTARAVAGKGADVVILGGLEQEHPLAPATQSEAVLLHAGRQGQYVVTADLGLKSRGTWEDASEWTRKEAQKDLDRQIGELRGRIAGWEKQEGVAASELDAQRARLRELERQRNEAQAPAFGGRWFRAVLHELAPEVPSDPALAAQLDAYDKRVNEHNRVSFADLVPEPAPPGSASFAGSESCAGCHEAAYAWWKKTPHGNAYATLERVHKQYNLNCVSCHVVGYNRPGGSTVTHVDKLKNVGCESCHGPGSLHNAQPDKPGLVARAVPEAVCASCHTHEHSDRFVYDAFRTMLIVPGHGLPADRK